MHSRRTPSDARDSQSHLLFGEDGGLSDRLPPQNLDAERGVLGAILLDNSVLHDVVSVLRKPDDFYRDAHQIVYRAICDMYNRGVTVDAVTLADELVRLGRYKQIGGDDMLAQIANSAPHAANARYHADIVKQKAVTRKWIETSTEIIRMGYSNLYTSKQIQEEAEKAIYAIADERSSNSSVGIADVMSEIMANIDRAKGGEVKGISTGLNDLDRLVKGFMPEKMYILAARTGEGKTALALNFARHAGAGENKYCTLFVSLEMGREELGQRWIASLARVDSQRLIDNEQFSEKEHKEVAKAAVKMNKARIHVSDSPNQSLMDISACARRLKQRDNLELLVVDYLGLISETKSKSENRTEVVGRISRGLKLLARELKIPVIALHQLNRESVKEKREPKLHDLRESGSIEQDADVVILLNSEMEESDKEGKVVAIVAKHRGGPRGRATLWFNKRFNLFESFAMQDQIRIAAEIPYDEYDNPDARPF
jgi:replicative DNA helicase